MTCPHCRNSDIRTIVLHAAVREGERLFWSGHTWRCLVCQTVFDCEVPHG
jgi:hypothetical protein